MSDQLTQLIIGAMALAFSAAAWYSLTKGVKILKVLRTVGESLTEHEQQRVDDLLGSGKRYHTWALIIAGILLAVSALQSFQGFSVPIGGMVFPRLEASLGLYFISLLLVMGADRFFLMAYPWLRLDDRRPPFHWIVMGLNFEKGYSHAFWIYLPAIISAVGVALSVRMEHTTPNAFSFTAILVSTIGLAYLPRTIYYWTYFIRERADHRGGAATLSIYLLYWYRVLRQAIFSAFIALPLILVVPAWSDLNVTQFYSRIILLVAFLYAARFAAGFGRFYRLIDRAGVRYGFPIVSPHYE